MFKLCKYVLILYRIIINNINFRYWRRDLQFDTELYFLLIV